MDVFEQLRGMYLAMRDSGRFDRALSEWGTRHSGLRDFEDFDAIERLCRESAAAHYEARDLVLAALCAEAADDERARVLLCGLFLPGLLEVRKRLERLRTPTSEELTAEILANFWIAVRSFTPDTTRVAQRLVNAALWRTSRTLRHEARWNRHEELANDFGEFAEAFAVTSPSVSASGTVPDGDAVGMLLAQAVADGALSAMEAELLAAPRGAFAERAAGFGLTSRNGRTRRQAARQRLRQWLDHRMLG